MADTSATATAVNVFTSPGEAFAAIKERPSAWLPILLLIAGIAAVTFVYMTSVDLPWFFETQLEAAANADLSAEEREQAAERAASVSPLVYAAIGTVTSSVSFLVVSLLGALYYTGVSFLTHDGVKFKQWFALLCWCSLPLMVGLVAQLVHLLSTDARFLMQDEINPFSFGNLLSIDRTGLTIVQRILLGLDVTVVWCLVLTVLGYQAFSKSSLGKAVAVVLGPLVVVVAVSTALALAR
ncbi:MAG TPA: YIP1 family protein [Gammaproteobacteria bacterium]